MTGSTARRGLRGSVAVSAVLVGAVAGAVLLSGSDQPVTARPYPRWQELPAPPLTARDHPLGVRMGHRVLVLGGLAADGSARPDGATYDLETGRWHRVAAPVPVRPTDRLVVAGGIAVLRHAVGPHRASWWSYTPRWHTWSPLRAVPRRASAPSSLGSEVYVLSGRRVVVYSVQLAKWTPLEPDRLRPALRHRRVTATPHGPVVTGYAGSGHRLVADGWDGLAWHRSRTGLPEGRPLRPGSRPDGVDLHGATGIRAGGRLILVAGARAWIFTP